MSAFSTEEYQRRLGATRQRMAEAEIDLLLVVDPANINYLTGYDGWSFYTPQAALLPVEDVSPLWIGRPQDLPTARATCWMGADFMSAYSERDVGNPNRHPMEAIAQQIASRGWSRRVIGVESDAYYFTARWQQVLNKALPQALFKDAYLLVNWVRAIKSDAEIEMIRKAARLSEHAMAVALDRIRPGIPQTDVLGDILRALVAGKDDAWGDYPSSRIHVAAGEWTDQSHAPFRHDPFPESGPVTLELGGTHKRYDAPLSRTLHIGPPPRKLAELAVVVREGLEAALEAVRPGVTCESVEAAWRSVIAKAGLEKDSRIGYSIGAGYPPTRIENTMSLQRGDQSILQPNMTFHMIPGMWLDGVGYELSETFRVVEGGVEIVTNFPRKLFTV